ncbi:MAG: hypothetical protein WDW38_007755 [Sanguina aurantia]
MSSADTDQGSWRAWGFLPPTTSSSSSRRGRSSPIRVAESDMDELAMLLADTPLRRLKVKEKLAAKYTKGGQLFEALALYQEILSLAQLAVSVYGRDKQLPLLLCRSHVKMAHAYFNVKYILQAQDHCNTALEVLPSAALSSQQGRELRKDIFLMLGETHLMSTPPKPVTALQMFKKAVDATAVEDITDLGVKTLISKCHGVMGEAKLQEACSIQDARVELDRLVATLQAKLVDRDDVSGARKLKMERPAVEQRLEDARNELMDEHERQQGLLSQASEQLELAIVTLMDVIVAKSDQLRSESGGDNKGSPELTTLWRLECGFMYKAAVTAEMQGNIPLEIQHLKEIVTAYGANNLAAGPAARALKRKAAALNRQKNYELMLDLQEQALEDYEMLGGLQSVLFPFDKAQEELGRADVLKLVGDVNVGARRFSKAKVAFTAALQLYSRQGDAAMVQELNARISHVNGHLNVEEDEPVAAPRTAW